MTEEHLTAIRRDLDLVLDGSRWSWGLMWENPGRGLDAERGVVHRAPTPEEAYERQQDPDFIAAPTFDIGYHHQARVAYRAAVKAVATCAVYLEAAARADGFAPSQPCPETSDYSPPIVLTLVVRHAQACAAVIRPEKHTRRLAHLRKLLDSAVRGLSPVLDHGPADDIAHREDAQPDRGIPAAERCDTCDLRKKRRKKGKGECSVCERWRQRHDGQERPRHLDPMTPREAQAKRIARGEHWGAA